MQKYSAEGSKISECQDICEGHGVNGQESGILTSRGQPDHTYPVLVHRHESLRELQVEPEIEGNGGGRLRIE